MAKARSPNYPMLDFGAALQAVRKAFEKDHRNKMSRSVLSKHLGHESLSGPALGKLGALRAYGLIDGNGDELRITDEAVNALMAPEGSSERATAITQLAMRPKLFQEIRKDFPGAVSQDNLKFWLIKKHFVPDAAEKAAKVYLATARLAEGGSQEYDSGSKTEPESSMTPVQQQVAPKRTGATIHVPLARANTPMTQESFDLDEGPVTVSAPAILSPESYQDMEDRIEIFLRGLKRRSQAHREAKEVERRLNPGGDVE